MKYKYFLIIVQVLLMVCQGCSELQQTSNDVLESRAIVINWHDSVANYREKARWGDGQAYLQLAACYHYGHGVERSFLLSYSMASMAERYGATDNRITFFLALPAEDPDRLLVEAMKAVDDKRYEEAQQKAACLAELGTPEADFVRGMVLLAKGEIDKAEDILQRGIRNGSELAKIALSVKTDENGMMRDYAEQLPEFYCVLARECFKSDFSPEEDEQAASLYRKADEALCLDRHGAQWLLGYYEHKAKIGQPLVSDEEIERLRCLSEKLNKFDW